MLIISDEEDRVVPIRTVAYRVDNLGDEALASTNVAARPRAWVLVILQGRIQDPERRIDKGYGGECPGLGIL